MKYLRKFVNRLQGMVEKLFPNWAHQRSRTKWERQWADPKLQSLLENRAAAAGTRGSD